MMMFLLSLSFLPSLVCTKAPANTPGCPLPINNTSSIPLATILVPVFIGFSVLFLAFIYGWRRFRRTTSKLTNTNIDLTHRLLQTENEVEKLRKVWQIREEEVEFMECIGRGAVGEVFKGRWRGMLVAVKKVKGAWMSSEEMEKELDHEASVLQAVRHAHVVQFFGMGAMNDGSPFMVTELMEMGTLSGILQNTDLSLDWDTKHRFAYETAQGMALVHSLGRMHRDLKSGNILVTCVGLGNIMRVKVADFGTATIVGMANKISLEAAFTLNETSVDQRVKTMHTKGIGTPLWMAPEVLAGDARYGPQADVYSFGIVMWEIASRKEPWSDVQGKFFMEELLQKIRQGIRPSIEYDWPKQYVNILQACWHTLPSERPTFGELVKLLKL